MTENQTTAQFNVAITYCDDTVFVHEHDEIIPAIGEYTELMAKAIERTEEVENARHIRLVTLLGYGEIGEQKHYIDTGVFPCEHKD